MVVITDSINKGGEMTALELKTKVLKKKYVKDATVLGIIQDTKTWYHIHNEEEIPQEHDPVIAVWERANKATS